MGSHIKTSIFDENTSKALKRWRDAAKKRYKDRSSHPSSVAPSPSPSPGQSPMSSPSHHLYQYNTVRGSHSAGNEFPDGQIEMARARSHELSRSNVPHEVQLNIEEERDEDGFSFAKPNSRKQLSK